MKTRRTTTRSWAEGCEPVRAAPRRSGSFIRRLRHLLSRSEYPQATFRIGDRVRITDAAPRFADRLGTEAIVASGLERGDDGQLYYRLDNNMSAQPECLTLLQSASEAEDGTR